MSNRHVVRFIYIIDIFILGEIKMNDKTNLKVALYMRYSSSAQSEQSIEGQERVCTEFCERENYTIVKKYVDRATSAFKDADKRVQFQKMIKDSEKGLWDAVVVYKLDRFARNRYDSATYKTRLKRNGVKLISATEAISDDPEGIILESILEGMAEYYSKELSQKVKRGMKETALKCHSCGGTIPLGYKIENKKYVIDQAGAKIVQEAFDLYNKNYPIIDICKIFEDKGYRTAQNKKFTKSSFNSMLRNKKYAGVYKYGDIEIDGGIPAIISKESFKKAQDKLEKQKLKQRRGRAKLTYLLSQKLFCGECGAQLIGESATGRHGKTYYYYTCGSVRCADSCNKKRMKKEYVEDIVFEKAMQLLTPETIDELAEMAEHQCMKDIEQDTVVPALQAEIDDVDRAINNLLKALQDGVATKTITMRIKELESQREDLEKRIVDAKSEFVVLEKEHIVWWLNRFTKGDKNDESFKRNILDMLINSVTIYDMKKGYRFVIAYNLNSNKSETFEVSSQSLNGAS